MATPSPSILLQHGQPNEARSHDQLHLMPFAINYEGPAEISKYFITRPLPPSAENDTAEQAGDFFESSFRGRYLHGTRIKVPPGYLGLVCSSSDTQSKHQSSAEPHPRPINPLPTSAHPRSTTRGRRRGRGRKLSQAVGTRATSSRSQLKRKHQDPEGFLSDEGDEDEAKNKEEKPQDEVPIPIPENRELDANEEDDESSKLEQPSGIITPSTDLMPIKLESPKPNVSVLPNSESNDPSIPKNGSKVIKSIGSFDQFTIWNPDGPADLPSDIYARSIRDWVGLAQLLHSVPST